MNNTILQQNINAVRRDFSDAEIRRIFQHRLDDEMFIQIGRVSVGRVKAKKLSGTELAWEGFEKILGIDADRL